MAAIDLYTQAVALLNACQTLLGTRTPALAYVSPGMPAIDCCDMLTVHVPSVGESASLLDVGHRYQQARVNLSTLVISITRCDALPNPGEAPSPVAKEAVAAEVLQDVWTLWNGLYRMISDGVLFEHCGERILGPTRAIDSQGGCVGFLITVQVSISGYDPLGV